MPMSGKLEIELLGELQIRREGKPCTLPQSKKTRALLAYLILNPGPHRRERLCEVFWQTPDDPRGSLRWSLSKLRALVDDDGTARIKSDRTKVEFEHLNVSIDLMAAREATEAGLESLDDEALSGLEQSLAQNCLLGLELSGQPDFEVFLAAERENVRALRVSVLRERLARTASTADKIPCLQSLVDIEPYDFELHLQLVSALASTGRHKDAERQRQQSAAVLGDISGVDLRALHLAANSRPGEVNHKAKSAVPPQALKQEIRFCKSADGTQIAYASVGEGPPLVKTANWLNHLEFDWESPVYRHVFRDLSFGRRLLRYDARGNGLSEWTVNDLSLDAMVSDLEAVVDAAGIDRFPLLGLSQGCAVSVEYTYRHPERVSKLIFLGGYARGWAIDRTADYIEQHESVINLIRGGWGQDNPAFRQLFSSIFMPDAPVENQRWFNELQRRTTKPGLAARLVTALGQVDVRERLAHIRVPTLVVHARGDMTTPLSDGQELAGGIPSARFVSLDTNNHIIPEDDPTWAVFMEEVEAFLAE